MTRQDCSGKVTHVITNESLFQVPYTYKVRIINPNKKSDFILRQLHRHHSRFSTVTAIRVSMIDEFDDQVPDSVKFNVGYIDGRHQMSLFNVDDLSLMYSKYKLGGEIILWCEGRCIEDNRGSRKKGLEAAGQQKQEREDQVDNVFADLKSKHNEKYTGPQLRLWSRMVCSGIHDDMDKPPDVPAFGASVKKPRKESLADAITGAAATLVKTFGAPDASSSEVHREPTPTVMGVSPGKTVQLRMKNLKQLQYLQSLFEDGILNESEYSEQKTCILSSLRKL